MEAFTMRLTANITYPSNLILKIRELSKGGAASKVLNDAITGLAIKLQTKIKDEKLSGQVLHVRSGALRQSINYRVSGTGSSITAEVFSHGVPYAAIHEFGGHTKPHKIEAIHAQALHFLMGGKDIFVKSVNHPGSVMPERSYMRSSLQEMLPEIRKTLLRAIIVGGLEVRNG